MVEARKGSEQPKASGLGGNTSNPQVKFYREILQWEEGSGKRSDPAGTLSSAKHCRFSNFLILSMCTHSRKMWFECLKHIGDVGSPRRLFLQLQIYWKELACEQPNRSSLRPYFSKHILKQPVEGKSLWKPNISRRCSVSKYTVFHFL